MKKRFLLRLICFFLLLSLQTLSAQTQKIVLEFVPISVKGASSEEALVLENLLLSYLSEKDLIIVQPNQAKREMPDVVAPPDYKMYSRLSLNNNNYVFEIDINKIDDTPFYKHVSSHKSSSEIALNLRSIIDEAFNKQTKNVVAGDAPVALTRDKILGLWKGDNGIELVRFLPDGKGFAFFSSGVNMMLTYTIEDNSLYILQVSPNNERFYYPLPLPVAKRLSEEAEPMRWVFSLYEGGLHLKGKRIETIAEYLSYDKISIIKDNVMEASWFKMPR